MASKARKNAWYVPKVIIFIASAILIFPGVDPLNWILPGEDYGVVAYGRWSLRDADGNLLFYRIRHDAALLKMLLQARLPERYGKERTDQNITINIVDVVE